MQSILITSLIALLLATPGPNRPPAAIDRLSWLAGCWELRAGNRITEEQWMRPLGKSMLGMSRTVRGDSTTEFEQLRIAEEGADLVYHANPSGQAPTQFRSFAITDSSISFQNPQHDFPQRILYRRVTRDSLVARIEGERGGRARGFDFPMRRVACP